MTGLSVHGSILHKNPGDFDRECGTWQQRGEIRDGPR